MRTVKAEDIGGAQVQRPFSMGGQRTFVGQELSREQVLSMPANNRNAMIDSGMIVIRPPKAAAEPAERFVVSRGFGKFDVIEGVKVNDRSLTKEEAEALVEGFNS